MMRNRLDSEIIISIQEQLSARLSPVGWSLSTSESSATAADTGLDAMLTIRSPDGRMGVMGVEIKRTIDPRMVSVVREQLSQSSFDTFLVGAPFLSPRTRKLLADANLNYVDLTGNLRFSMSQPAVFIETQGETKNPQRESRPVVSLKGRAASRVVRGLCDFRPPYSTSDLAEKSGASLSSTSRALTLLESEALITATKTKKRRGIVTEVAWTELIRRWAQDYSVLKANTVSALIAPRGLTSLQKDLSEITAEYSVTGSLAARIPTSVAPTRLAMIYATDPVGLADLLDLRPAEAGANVLLLQPFDSVVFERTVARDGLRCAAFSQVAADLLTSPGRGPEEGDELLRWMKENENEWRT